jgi:hypothetical protein
MIIIHCDYVELYKKALITPNIQSKLPLYVTPLNRDSVLAEVERASFFIVNSKWNSVCVDNPSVSLVWRVAKRFLPSAKYSFTQENGN